MITGGIGLSNFELTLIICLVLLLLALLAFIINKCCAKPKYEPLPSDKQQDYKTLQGDYDELKKVCAKLEQEHEQVKCNLNDLKKVYSDAAGLLSKLESDLGLLRSDYNMLQNQYEGLEKDRLEALHAFRSKYKTLRNAVQRLIKSTCERSKDLLQGLNILVKLRKTQLSERLSKAKLMGRHDFKEFMVYELVVLQGALNDLIQSSNNEFCIESEKMMSALSNVVVDGV